jgi:hypothetical protein
MYAQLFSALVISVHTHTTLALDNTLDFNPPSPHHISTSPYHHLAAFLEPACHMRPSPPPRSQHLALSPPRCPPVSTKDLHRAIDAVDGWKIVESVSSRESCTTVW